MRIGAVNYLNSKPLVYGLERLAPEHQVLFDLPSRLADSLAAGRLDVALVPSVELFGTTGNRIVSSACVACRGPVLSVKLHFRVPPAQVEVVPVGGFTPVATTTPRPAPVVVTLTISSRCQLRVVADGNEIIGRTMEQGETLPIELGDELVLQGDNASAVQFSINGQAGRLLGEPGEALSARIGRDDYQDFLVRY